MTRERTCLERIAEQYLSQFPVERFSQQLLDWYDQNKRDLPWRKDRDPYKIWVSEIMLQQTQVDTVIPYYQRFMARFPTLTELAEAEEEEVLKYWEGLGYYSRARHLHQAVKEVQERYGGEVPQDRKTISKLKGVGDYTAGAILSIAYDLPEPAVDGNVLRVLSRLLLIDQEVDSVRTRRLFEGIALRLIPEGRAGDFNQALMELGALVCTPKAPQCLTCPVWDVCRAFQEGKQQELPLKSRKKNPKTVHLVAGVVTFEDRVLIRRRPEHGLLAKMYEFPTVEWHEQGPLETICRHLQQTYQLKIGQAEQWSSVQHTFSHLIWDVTVYRLSLLEANDTFVLGDLGRWERIDALDQFPFPVSHQKIRKELQKKKNSLFNA